MRIGKKSGAILADVLAAAFILGVGVLAVAGLFIQIVQAGQSLSRQEHASFFAGDGMERLRHWGGQEWTAQNLADAADPAWLEKDGVRFERTILLRLRTDLDPAGHLLEGEVQVNWTENGQARRMVLLTYFAVDTEVEGLR